MSFGFKGFDIFLLLSKLTLNDWESGGWSSDSANRTDTSYLEPKHQGCQLSIGGSVCIEDVIGWNASWTIDHLN
jgi:hypothetical protein